MNYYLIPKNNFNVKLKMQLTNDKISPFMSYSLFFYLNDVYSQVFKLDKISDENEITIEYINKIVNPFEFIHTNVPGSVISVSKVKPDSNIFFELMEIFQLFNINEILSLKHKINIAHFTPNYTSTNYLLNMLREDNDDYIICEEFNYDLLLNKFVNNSYENKIDLMICEFNENDYTNVNNYIQNVVLILLLIIRNQSNQGTCVFKLNNIFYKPIIDVLFMLSSLYDRMYLIKPSISNITTGERYIICKTFNARILDQSNLRNDIESTIISLNSHFNKYINNNNVNAMCIKSLIENEIPYYFLNKLEESNAVIGQQQLEAYDQIINIFKNKSRDDKIENLKRNHIQKCIQWCEKNQLPHNKFIDKINIFLSPKKKDFDEEMI
jgi:hypothetical protein